MIDGKVMAINRARAEAQHSQQTSGLRQEIEALKNENAQLRASAARASRKPPKHRSKEKEKETMIKGQVHSKFKVFIPEAGITDEEAMRRLGSMVEGWVRANKVAVKSVGIEYIENRKQVVLSLGYREDEPGYPVKLASISLGVLTLMPDEIAAAMERAADGVENVICHEFFVDGVGNFVMVLLSHG